MTSNPQIPDYAGTRFTILFYSTSATFPSRKIFRVIYAFSTPSNKIGNSFFVVLLCEVALQSSKYFAEQCDLSPNNEYRSRRFTPYEIHPWRNQLSISERGSYRIKRYKPRNDANLLYQRYPHILLRNPKSTGCLAAEATGAN